MPPITTTGLPVEEQVEMESTEAPKSEAPKSFVGIIYPPPEIRNIVDKTANFVARNGPEFESRIRKNEANNPKFNFLMPKDPYHAYYLHKVKDFQEGKGAESQKAAVPLMPSKVQDAVMKATEQFVPKEPPPEFEFMADPTTISAHDLDLLKLTAQFVARNGRQFLTQLMNREARNYQFDFLKPQHSMFPYFTKLVEQYTKILIPPKDILQTLRKEASSTKTVLDQAKYRVEWLKHQLKIREKEEAEVEKERVAYASIDWHDFVVVQTVDFQPHEQLNLPPPCCPKDVGARILAQQRVEATKTTQAMEMEMESDSDEEEGPGRNKVVQPVPVAPKLDSVTVLKDYDPKTGRSQVEKVKNVEQKFVISPLTGEKVPADKLAEHMRLNTIDSQYLRQREQDLANRQDEEQVFAPGIDILSHIKGFAARRSDIFGTGAEETTIGRKMGEEEDMNPKAVWEGHTAASDAATKAAGSQITIEEQIAQIHRAKGLVSDDGKERIGPKTSSNQPLVSQITAEPVLRAVTQQIRPPTMSAPPIPTLPRLHAPTVVGMLPMGAQQMVVMPQQNPMAMGLGMMQMGQMPQYQMQMNPPVEEDDEPQSKRQKTAEDHLIPEADFLTHHRGPVEIVVQVPNVPDKPEWLLNGKSLTFVMHPTDPISLVKTKIQEITKMPTSKQKLVYENIFIKDSNTLAYYNMLRGANIQLQMKERGGRKK